MRKVDKQLVFSPSDLITFMESPFDSWMERYHLEYPGEQQPDDEDESHAILAKHGDAHELSFLNQLKNSGVDVAEVDGSCSEHARLATINAMREGREIVFQGYLSHGPFAGKSDFLCRVEGSSELGDFHYEVWDTKLARKAKPYFIVQLCCYAEMLESIQGRLPYSIRVVLGNLEQHQFHTEDYIHQFRQLKESFLEFQCNFSRDISPQDCSAGNFSRWKTIAEKILKAREDLSLVANIRKTQIKRLRDASVSTITQLSQRIDSIAGMCNDTLSTLRQQARLQLQSQAEERTVFEVLPPIDGKGLCLLPPASVNDVYFDMEGYPLMDGGLEYLFGAVYITEPECAPKLPNEDGSAHTKTASADKPLNTCHENQNPVLHFKDWWAHDRDQEKKAFERFVDWVYARWLEDPSMHVYHYAAYEVSALRRLACRHSTRVEEIDDLLRQEVFVDLYQVVRHGIRVGEPSYSIKYVEHLFRPKRSGSVSKATDSVVFYESWLENQDGLTWQDSQILKEIRDYNEVDCVSTYQLAVWLRNVQQDRDISYTGKIATPPPPVRTPRPESYLAAELLASASKIEDAETRRVQELLAGLLEFHRRADKPMWWRRFDRQKMTSEELYDDLDCLAGLTRTETPPVPRRMSLDYEYKFDPDQDTKLDSGSTCLIASDLSQVKLVEINRSNGLAIITLGKQRDQPPDVLDLLPDEYVNSDLITDSIVRTGLRWLNGMPISQCLYDLLFRQRPRLRGTVPLEQIVQSPAVEDIARAIGLMHKTCLCIQGPPGTGKTYTASHTIVELLRQGKRIGITSNSHKAIDNLLHKVISVSAEQDVACKAAKVRTDSKSSQTKTESDIHMIKGSAALFALPDLDSYNVFAGTAWLFSHHHAVGLVDYLFVDEAGQVSLANVAGMSPSTDNLVLLGDQMQLEQPVEGSHPGNSGDSALQYLLENRQTIPDDMGIFLGITRRMHSQICSIISTTVYDSRLHSHPDNDRQILLPPQRLSHCFDKTAGIIWHPVEH
ncbi:MAG: TM0106 family RecB-like putative nuclease, partial [Cyanobacteria bacterium]|nr:TM0106 family RecB-like putative nuclease [Cyanobacteriota bacterium]